MKFMHNFFSIFSAKPVLGAVAGAGSLLSAILTWLAILTPILGFIGALFGAIAAYYAMRGAVRKWDRGNNSQ